MSEKPLSLPRPRLLSAEHLAQIHEAAVRILAENGVRVHHEGALAACARAGLHVREGRVFPERREIEGFISDTKARPPRRPAGDEPPGGEIVLGVGQYATAVHDLDSDTLVPMTAERLIEAARFADAMTSRNLIAKAPGVPVDVAPDLQPVLQYRISAEHCRHGRTPPEVRSPQAMPYVMDIADALGEPMRGQPVYVVTPLTVGSDSFACALAGRDRLEAGWVSDMLSVGGTAPIRIADALALAVAEVVGAGIVAREATGLRVEWSIRACPLDMRTMVMSLGSPEELLFQWASEEVNAWCHGEEPGPPGGSLHTQAKLPGPQAAAERMSQLAVGALFGARSFGGAGRLSLDEVFSAEQVVIDCELRDHVQRLIAGIDAACDPAASVAEVAAGLADGFPTMESTARQYRDTYWLPSLFERRPLHEYELEPELRRELARIYAGAEAALAG